MFIKRIIFILAAVMAAAPTFAVDPAHPMAPLINYEVRDKIKDQYIVVFDLGTPPSVIATRIEEIAKLSPPGKFLREYYSKALVGFAAMIPDKVLGVVRQWPGVIRVEANLLAMSTSTIQTGSPKGIDRVDQRLLPLSTEFHYTETGKNVHVYVLDNGVLPSHTEFDNQPGRVSEDFSYYASGDCNGHGAHGTHVAGIIGGKTYGIAKKVSLHSIRVLDCSGYGELASILAGINWVTNWVTNHPQTPAVVNMSLRLGYHSDTLDETIRNSIATKITYVVAAGNLLGRNACAYSPADVKDAITVGSVDPKNDKRSVLSATGQCIDLFAPGVRIRSATASSDSATEEMSGTSMAAAFVSGVAALYLQNHVTDPIPPSPSQVWDAIHRSDDVWYGPNNPLNTPDWPGIDNAGPCSPSEMLHWGPRDAGFTDDPSPNRRQTNAPNRNGSQ
jgi:hypothetical protein